MQATLHVQIKLVFNKNVSSIQKRIVMGFVGFQAVRRQVEQQADGSEKGPSHVRHKQFAGKSEAFPHYLFRFFVCVCD